MAAGTRPRPPRRPPRCRFARAGRRGRRQVKDPAGSARRPEQARARQAAGLVRGVRRQGMVEHDRGHGTLVPADRGQPVRGGKDDGGPRAGLAAEDRRERRHHVVGARPLRQLVRREPPPVGGEREGPARPRRPVVPEIDLGERERRERLEREAHLRDDLGPGRAVRHLDRPREEDGVRHEHDPRRGRARAKGFKGRGAHAQVCGSAGGGCGMPSSSRISRSVKG